jgi:NAD(P)-dependent dehydrogenase (short-subunit alcohol dehydrogenase family)
MTTKVFWKDPYLTELETTVRTVCGNKITLVETIFYAFSGGQESDAGTIGGYQVLNAQKDGTEIYYTIAYDHKLKVEDVIKIVIDWDQRYSLMRLHFAAEVVLELVCQKLFNIVDKELGTLTALVNNVGILEQQMRVEQMDMARLERIFRTNIASYFLCARQAVRRMSTIHGGKGGAIVNVSSVASRLGSAGEYVDYAASKGAIDTLTIGLSIEVANEGIRVNSVRPGFIYTDIHARGGEPDRVERIKSQLPMQRGGKPAEVANAILWLLSEEASYVTGTFIDLAGGK